MTMTRAKIIDKLQQFFTIKELVCEHTLARFGNKAWQFFDTDTLHTLLVIRKDILKVPLTCNINSVYQRGLRCNICPLVKSKQTNYLSAHVMGKGFDFVSQDMSAAQMRSLIVQHQDLLPIPIRLEGGVSWLHVDTFQTNDKNKVTIFNV